MSHRSAVPQPCVLAEAVTDRPKINGYVVANPEFN